MIFDKKSFMVALGKRLKEHRDAKFTLDQLIAEARLDMSRSSLSAIENGYQEISALDLYAISTVLNFTLNDIIDEVMVELLNEKFPINTNR